MAAKKTSDLIPLCHPLQIDNVQINFDIDYIEKEIIVRARVECEHKTGVEMEALSAVSISLLTIYDMCKAVSHEMELFDIKLLNKNGGKNKFSR